jgi:hypothetical protein
LNILCFRWHYYINISIIISILCCRTLKRQFRCNYNLLLFLIKNNKSTAEQRLIKKNKTKKKDDFIVLISKSQIFTICSLKMIREDASNLLNDNYVYSKYKENFIHLFYFFDKSTYN